MTWQDQNLNLKLTHPNCNISHPNYTSILLWTLHSFMSCNDCKMGNGATNRGSTIDFQPQCSEMKSQPTYVKIPWMACRNMTFPPGFLRFLLVNIVIVVLASNTGFVFTFVLVWNGGYGNWKECCGVTSNWKHLTFHTRMYFTIVPSVESNPISEY